MFYILIKNPEHYLVVQQKLLSFGCEIFDVRGVIFDKQSASSIYSDLKGLTYFQNAVNSIINKTTLVLRFTHSIMNIDDIKKLIQGPYGNLDESTIRGYLTIYLNNGIVDSFVHIPDSIQKIEEDLLVIEQILC